MIPPSIPLWASPTSNEEEVEAVEAVEAEAETGNPTIRQRQSK